MLWTANRSALAPKACLAASESRIGALWAAAEEQAVEEGVVLLAPGTEVWHLCKELQQLLSSEGLEAEKLLRLLDVRQLMRSQQATAKWIGLRKVGDEADCRLWKGVQTVVEPALLVGDVAQPEHPSALVNHDRGLVVQNGGSLTALVTGASSGRGMLRCSMLLLRFL
jgi:hypothetical protein